LYGLQSYLVANRRPEIGIRMALGAPQRQVAAEVIRHGLILAFIGACLGTMGALALGRLIESMLFGVRARDPMTTVTIPVILLAAAFLASCVPALRASRIPPMEALRNE
jgi:putative ABC transport system permease protein